MKALTDKEVSRILKDTKTVAILGAHLAKGRPAFYVPDYLHSRGYQVIPVNPLFVGESLWGEPFRAKLSDIQDPICMVDVFRNGRHLDAHVDDLLAMAPAPAVVWFQFGVHNDEVAHSFEAAGIQVVLNRCTMADHRRLIH